MPMLKKSQVFYFLLFFAVAFAAGFFIRGAMPSIDNDFFGLSRFFTASLPENKIGNAAQPAEPVQAEPAENNLGPVESPDIAESESAQDRLDDIQERIDIIKQKIQALIAEQNKNNQVAAAIEDKRTDNAQENNQNQAPASGSQAPPIVLVSSGGGGGSSSGGGGGGGGPAPVIYSKILISEVQISPISQRFVELYNPNSTDVNLTGWYLQRKDSNDTSWGSSISATNFSGTLIPANGYFLISRELSNSDILSAITLSANNSLAFKNPAGDISDQASFGEIPVGQSWGRKDSTGDFEADAPTPRAQNIAYVAPLVPGDITPPFVDFSVGQEQNSLNFSVNFTITDLVGTVSASGVGGYIFQWQEDGGNWQADDSVVVAGSPVSGDFIRDFTGEDGKTYNFQVKAKDVAGNESGWLPVIPATTKIVLQKNILITDVQIEGETKDNDSIKFYNPNAFDVLLKDYRLVKRSKSSSGDITIKSWSKEPDAKISGQGYYLWASSTDESYPSLVGADASTKQNISPDNGIALRNGYEDSGEIIDAVGWGDFDNILFEGKSFSQNPGKSQELKRIKIGDSYQDSNDNSVDFSLIDTTSPSNL